MNTHNKTIANQYDIICDSFDNSRVRIWNNVKIFLLDGKDSNENLLDCGCGNGKNMLYANSLGYTSEGFDISDNLLYICHNKGLNVFYQDVLNLKLEKKYDKIISIAVFDINGIKINMSNFVRWKLSSIVLAICDPE